MLTQLQIAWLDLSLAQLSPSLFGLLLIITMVFENVLTLVRKYKVISYLMYRVG